MPGSYKVVSKRPGGMAGPSIPKYYPIVTKRETIDSREFAELISEGTTFSTADVLGVIETLVQMVPFYLQQGNNIRLDNFGTFSLHVSGVEQENPKKVTKRDITKVRMTFLPSKEIKRKLTSTQFVKVK